MINQKQNIINICFSSDDNYVQHMYICIMSILNYANVNDFFNFYILNGGISKKNLETINKLKKDNKVDIHFIDVDKNDFSSCPMTNYVNYITLPTYYRFKIASLIPEIDKIIYLDSDIVLNADISELYNTNIDNYYIGAIPEVNNHHHKKRFSFNDNQFYINAGVMLINIKKWNEDNIENKLFEYIKHPAHKIIYQDQDIINDVLKDNIKYIDLSWNLQHDAILDETSYIYHRDQRSNAVKSPNLIHFTHKYKPWNPKCYNKFRKFYYLLLIRSPWKYKIVYLYLINLIFSMYRFLYRRVKLNDGKIKIVYLIGIPVYKRIRENNTTKKIYLGVQI